MEDYMKDMTFHKSPSTYHFKFTIQSSTENFPLNETVAMLYLKLLGFIKKQDDNNSTM